VSEDLLATPRENWGSRTGFVLAAIGSAVGLGNLWGFPYKVYDHGGGAFLIPYVLAMVFVGIPVLILEFSLGHMTQRAAPEAFRGINRKTEPIGWWGILLGFVIITYYPVVLAWCLSFLWTCLKGIFNGGDLPWAGAGLAGVENAKKHFFVDYLGMWQEADLVGNVKPWSLGGLIRPIALSLLIVWVLMYLCIFRGVKAVSKVVLLTVPLPWIMLLILTLRGLTLPGAAIGLKYYLEPSWAELAKPETWRWAFGQMFFSMSLAFGVMITYASFLHRKSDLNNNAAIIGLADVGTSFVAGIAVFATLGAMAFVTRQMGQAVEVTEVVKGGPGLAFVAFPYALAQLPYSAWFGAIFFLALLTLGIDSAFSITESVLASLVDKTGWNRNHTLLGMSLVGLGIGLVYCTRGGLFWLGGMDEFINGWAGITLLGLLECVVLGWAYRLGRLREHANELSDWRIYPWWDWSIRYIGPIILSALVVWSLLDHVSSPGGLFHDAAGELVLPNVLAMGVAVLAPVLALVLSLVRSPGADTHAQHVGQRRAGRSAGLLGCLLVLAGIGAVVWGFSLTRAAKIAQGAGQALETVLHFRTVGSYQVPQATLILCGGVALGLLAALIGSRAVVWSERNARRPSGLARLSAGLGVMVAGSGAGALLALLVLLNEFAGSTQPSSGVEELGSASYVVLTSMATLLVVGLGWCFYRAIKAAGATEAPEQVSEGLENS